MKASFDKDVSLLLLRPLWRAVTELLSNIICKAIQGTYAEGVDVKKVFGERASKAVSGGSPDIKGSWGKIFLCAVCDLKSRPIYQSIQRVLMMSLQKNFVDRWAASA